MWSKINYLIRVHLLVMVNIYKQPNEKFHPSLYDQTDEPYLTHLDYVHSLP